MAKNDSGSPISHGVRSPMNGYEQQQDQRIPSCDAGTSEMIKGTAPKAAKVSSPTQPKNPGKSN